RFIVGVASIDYGPVLLLKPFGFHLAVDTLPSGLQVRGGFRSALAVSGFRLRARVGGSIPSALPGQRGVTPAFGYGAPHSSARAPYTPPNNALLTTHHEPRRPRLVFGRFPGRPVYPTSLAPPLSRRDEDGFSSCSACPCHRAVPTYPAGVTGRIGQPAVCHAA